VTGKILRKEKEKNSISTEKPCRLLKRPRINTLFDPRKDTRRREGGNLVLKAVSEFLKKKGGIS